MKNTKWRSIRIPLVVLALLFLYSAQSFVSVQGGTITPTSTIVPDTPPTVTPNIDLIQKVDELMTLDKECKLPCLWGIHPGKTTAEQFLQFVKQNFDEKLYAPALGRNKQNFDESLYGPASGNNKLQFYELFLYFDPGSFQSVFRIDDNNRVAKIELRLSRSASWLSPNPFALSEVLKSMGRPTDVYMRINPSPPISYSLAVIYKDKGVIVEYVVDPSDISDDERIPICPYLDETTDLVKVWLQSPENHETVIDNLEPAPSDTLTYGPYWTLKQMTDLSIDDFTKLLTSTSGVCITAKSLDELSKDGYRF